MRGRRLPAIAPAPAPAWAPGLALVLALLGALVVSLVGAGCDDEGDPLPPTGPEAGAPSFAADVQPIFDDRCVECHGVGGNGGLDLRAGESFDALVGVVSPNYGAVRVIPGDAEGSVLFDKIRGGGVYGDRMPLGRTPLSEARIGTIRAWIEAGAARD